MGLEIIFEYPAKSFEVLVDDTKVYETTTNSLSKVSIPLGVQTASSVKIVMKEAHPLSGKINDVAAVYGISSLVLSASTLKTTIENCDTPFSDSRDKYFATYIASFDPSPLKSFESQLPALEAAKASLAATTIEVAEAVASLSSCGVASL